MGSLYSCIEFYVKPGEAGKPGTLDIGKRSVTADYLVSWLRWRTTGDKTPGKVFDTVASRRQWRTESQSSFHVIGDVFETVCRGAAASRTELQPHDSAGGRPSLISRRKERHAVVVDPHLLSAHSKGAIGIIRFLAPLTAVSTSSRASPAPH